MESKYIQGMASGTLDPDKYGGFMVQDAAYCFNAVEVFDYGFLPDATAEETWIFSTV